ncbi:divalent-cation tolerance protein CutA [Actinokineospora terrae]|uniref:Divalent cation tolerance protein n=1 Tax=Actinokineospora terrae TaxID=155974 RepID=A0A1H9RV37_9PSEU|nr:divalent-cation tolerance protein CutA [Actinokineospora terrae]SER75993.1 divalent cation tolerance protein [Actinokineospora terrae]
MQACEVVITAADAGWLVDFTRALVADRLVACGQHISPVRSVYRWDGAIQDDVEARVALHTRLSLVPEIVARADRDHPYDVPCVFALPIQAGNPAYLAWIVSQTREPADHDTLGVDPTG